MYGILSSTFGSSSMYNISVSSLFVMYSTINIAYSQGHIKSSNTGKRKPCKGYEFHTNSFNMDIGSKPPLCVILLIMGFFILCLSCMKTGIVVSLIVISYLERTVWWWYGMMMAAGVMCHATTICPILAKKAPVSMPSSEVSCNTLHSVFL